MFSQAKPVHRHTKNKTKSVKIGVNLWLESVPTEPLGYLEFLNLMANARLVLTDSGGIQEETTILGVPCLTLRENTERPVTMTQGTNTIVGCDPRRIVTEALTILDGKGKTGRVPELWDGQAAERIVKTLFKGD